MASNTKRLKVRRAIRKASEARKRKNRTQKHGTTAPGLPLDKPNANEKAQARANQ